MTEELKRTPLHGLHEAWGARMTGFAGYALPLQYPAGVLAEHRHTRAAASLFDVSHMGPFFLRPRAGSAAGFASLAAVAEALTSADVAGLAPGRMRYAVLLDPAGGMLDDLMIARPPEGAEALGLYLVVNGATKEGDLALFRDAAGADVEVVRADQDALLAVQGPAAAGAVEALLPGAARLAFMQLGAFAFAGATVLASRSGYTGEDGFELLVPAALAPDLARRLVEGGVVRPAGLGARDSLRLEAGLPLYGHDADASTSPVEAGLGFAVSRRRLREGALRGGERLARELAEGPARTRVGLAIIDGPPAREGAEILGPDGAEVGRVTSGGFSPTLSRPIAMGYVPPDLAEPGQSLGVRVRGRVVPAEVRPTPFVPHRYVRQP